MICKEQEYFIIFDTNILYNTYNKKTDFTSFKFNGSYDTIISMVNTLDIYDNVTLLVPEIVWGEMTEQIIDAHSKELEELKSITKKYSFPEFTITENPIGDYSVYIRKK